MGNAGCYFCAHNYLVRSLAIKSTNLVGLYYFIGQTWKGLNIIGLIKWLRSRYQSNKCFYPKQLDSPVAIRAISTRDSGIVVQILGCQSNVKEQPSFPPHHHCDMWPCTHIQNRLYKFHKLCTIIVTGDLISRM